MVSSVVLSAWFIVRSCVVQGFTSKQQVYDSLDSDAERARLKEYDSRLVIKPQDVEAMRAKKVAP